MSLAPSIALIPMMMGVRAVLLAMSVTLVPRPSMLRTTMVMPMSKNSP